jgi:hypothetical protein
MSLLLLYGLKKIGSYNIYIYAIFRVYGDEHLLQESHDARVVLYR